MAKTQTPTGPTFTRGSIPKKVGGGGRKPSADRLAFVAAALTADKENAVGWTPGVNGVSTKATNLRKAHPELTVVVRGDTIYGFNPSL